MKECTSALLRFAKKTNIPVLLVGSCLKNGFEPYFSENFIFMLDTSRDFNVVIFHSDCRLDM